MNYKHAAIARLILLVMLLINQTLIAFGKSPLPFDDAEIEAGINAVLLTATSLWAWWKNNNITEEAQEAQEILESKKGDK